MICDKKNLFMKINSSFYFESDTGVPKLILYSYKKWYLNTEVLIDRLN